MSLARKILAALFAVSLTGCTTSANSEDRCIFKYDRAVLDELVIPAVKAKYGERYKLFYKIYNYNEPTVSKHDDKIELIFDQWKPQEGHTPIDAPFFVVVVDPCAQRVLESYETDSWLNSPKNSQ
jgi:hypothetical protein